MKPFIEWRLTCGYTQLHLNEKHCKTVDYPRNSTFRISPNCIIQMVLRNFMLTLTLKATSRLCYVSNLK